MASVIDQLTIGGYGPIKDATLELSPLHALIGPNDSGKSMTLRAVAAVLDDLRTRTTARFSGEGGEAFDLQIRDPECRVSWKRSTGFAASPQAAYAALGRGARTLRLDPDAMREYRPLLADTQPFDFIDERGRGLGRLIDAHFARRPEERERFTEGLRAMFPSVEGFRLFTRQDGRSFGVRLRSGVEIGPEHLSEGMLYFLAFSLLPHLQASSVVLVEEPENGLHPARIKEVVRILRAVSKNTQVLLATHSPLLVNELEPHEVSLVTRTETEGTRFTRMDKTPFFAERSKAWNLGELWIALSDGLTEEALLKPRRAG